MLRLLRAGLAAPRVVFSAAAERRASVSSAPPPRSQLPAGVARIEPPAQAAAPMRHLPYFCRGEVVRGFGRGSKELGIPTGEGAASPLLCPAAAGPLPGFFALRLPPRLRSTPGLLWQWFPRLIWIENSLSCSSTGWAALHKRSTWVDLLNKLGCNPPPPRPFMSLGWGSG